VGKQSNRASPTVTTVSSSIPDTVADLTRQGDRLLFFRNIGQQNLWVSAGVRVLQIPVRMQKTCPARILELDALRGLAALAVVLFHYTIRYDELFGHAVPLAASVPWGHFGVDLFFMLSGFVILMTLERTANAWRFAWGRFSRLYPAYWAAAALTFAIVSLYRLPGQEVSLGDALLNLTMVQALLGAPHIDGAYWSLQAELIFYANMLVVFRCGALRRPTLAVAGWLVVAVTVRLTQAPVESVWPWAGELLSKFTTIASLKYIPLFAIGILIYASRTSGRMSLATTASIAASLVVAGWFNGFPTAAVDAALAGALMLAVAGRLPVLTSRPLVALGAISYTLYLVHQNIGYVAIREMQAWGASPGVAIAAAVLVSLGLASTLHRLVEQPAMNGLRSRDPANIRRQFCPVPLDA
jgi:peptidoglycan/LPS O-acetylase OafA/YrhL